MKILKYNKETEVLSVQYNTKVIWDYLAVQEDDYKHIVKSNLPEKELKAFLNKFFIVGINRRSSNAVY